MTIINCNNIQFWQIFESALWSSKYCLQPILIKFPTHTDSIHVHVHVSAVHKILLNIFAHEMVNCITKTLKARKDRLTEVPSLCKRHFPLLFLCFQLCSYGMENHGWWVLWDISMINVVFICSKMVLLLQ